MASAWRYIAQRALTGEFLELDLPMERDELSWTLSGAGSLRGTVTPDIGRLRADDGSLLLEEWGTLIYAEADGEIRWGGILVSSTFEGEAWTIEAAGFATYPHGLPYVGDFSKVAIDPADAFREIWTHIQSHPDGDLKVTVDGTPTKIRLGTKEEPYALSWWETPDCGSEIDSLVRDAPFDFIERHTWSGETITHSIDIGYPRHGRKREDLAFVQGDNVVSLVTFTRDGDDFANEVVGLGAGEGRKGLRSTVAVRDGRLRRAAVYTDKGITSSARLDSRIKDELAERQNLLDIREITVHNHPNAKIGAWNLGDDILVQATVPWLGDVDLWCRITSWSLQGEDIAVLTLTRSDSFRYGG